MRASRISFISPRGRAEAAGVRPPVFLAASLLPSPPYRRAQATDLHKMCVSRAPSAHVPCAHAAEPQQHSNNETSPVCRLHPGALGQ